MATRACANVSCGAVSSIKWIKGWQMRSGGFASLCDQCGSSYEQSIFCDTFHLKESGWRECDTCSKRLHCGCIASKALLVLTDNGGVQCISCVKISELSMISSDEKPEGICKTTTNNLGERQLNPLDYRLLQSVNMEGTGQNRLLQSQSDATGSSGPIKREQVPPSTGEVGSTTFSGYHERSFGITQLAKQSNHKEAVGIKAMYESLSQTCLTMTLGVPSDSSNVIHAQPLASLGPEGRDQNKMSPSLQQGQRSRPRISKMGLGIGTESSKDNFPQLRVARPPVEGRGRNQLLPRYWPRITDQELQQISGDSNSTIVPLFEKVLSASDAGRIGRLVLPKACAEAYFPPISQPEGLPLRIQDVKGKEWLFQFRFWPNNNSRMYVLEGVTPCIQSMQLQAGDTVTFSRLDPEGKLVMGFRKASNSMTLKDTQTPHQETSFSGIAENLPMMSGYSGFLQSLKGNTDPHLNVLSERLHPSDGDASLCKSEKHGGLSLQPEKKRSRNIGSKSKRLVIDREDSLELRYTWEEAQDLLRPPPNIIPSVSRVEDFEFEEYEEPPVFGKKTIFTSRSPGGQEQWAQCDNCYKWRRLPVDVLLPGKWTCSKNAWDSKRLTCSVPNELSPMELENLLRLHMDFKKRKMTATQPVQDHEPSGLDALATAAVLNDDLTTSFPATTTKHPRHRPGCTCIVCIQPPSGKGPKHKPTCTCNVCMTVKRRFKTLMMRKKKRQSEKAEAEAEAEALNKLQVWFPNTKDEIEVESIPIPLSLELTENPNANAIDLNSQPEREDGRDVRLSMTGLLQSANRPLEAYLRQNGLASLASEQASSSSRATPPPELPIEEEQERVHGRESGDEG